MKNKATILIVLALALILAFSLVACNDGGKDDGTGGGGFDLPAYTGEGTKLTSQTLTAADLTEYELGDMSTDFVSGSVETYSGVSSSDVEAYAKSLCTAENGWNAVWIMSGSYMLYKGDTIVEITCAAGTMVVLKIELRSGTVQREITAEGIVAGFGYTTDFSSVGMSMRPGCPQSVTPVSFVSDRTEKSLTMLFSNSGETAIADLAVQFSAEFIWLNDNEQTIVMNATSLANEIRTVAGVMKSLEAHYSDGTTTYDVSITQYIQSNSEYGYAAGYLVMSIEARGSNPGGGGGNPGGGDVTSWPAESINTILPPALASAVPAYATSSTSFSVTVNAAGKTATVVVKNTSYAESSAYDNLLTSSGFYFSSGKYMKSYTGGSKITVVTSYSSPTPDSAETTIVIAYVAAEGSDATWLTTDQCTALSVGSLAQPTGMDIVGKTFLSTNAGKTVNAALSFSSVTTAEFNAYAEILFNAGFNKNDSGSARTAWNADDSSYYTSDGYATFFGKKIVSEFVSVTVSMSLENSDASMTFTYKDSTPRTAWLTSDELTEIGFADLVQPAGVTVENVSYVRTEIFAGVTIVNCSVKLSGITRAQAFDLCSYFYDKGAKYYDEALKDAYDNTDLMWSESDCIAWFANYVCENCDVRVDHYSTQDGSNSYLDIDKPNCVSISIMVYANHVTGGHTVA